MNNFYHFGDSYATVKLITLQNKHFCNIIAEKLNMEYHPFGLGGISNEMILGRVLENLHKFKDGDIIFINFSFFERGSYYDKKDNRIKPTSPLYNDIIKVMTPNPLIGQEYVMDMVNYYINNTEDYAKRTFNLFNLILKYLNKLGVTIFYIFAGEADYEDELIHVGTNLKFKKGFCNWLKENDFHRDQDVHYTLGIQPMLADVIFTKTNNMNKENNKKIKISIEDVDLKKILKSEKFI